MSATSTPSGTYDDLTREELYELAQERDVPGRSEMSKDELAEALRLHDLGPDAVELILEHHARIRELLDQYAELSSRPSQKKQDLVRDLITLLVRHAEVEEQVFYPAVLEMQPDLQDEIDEDLEEHHVGELLMWELDHLPVDAERYDAKVEVLGENMRHHLEEEEEGLLPQVREQIDEETRRRLGRAMQEMFVIAPERPHPLSPSTAPANVIAGLPAALADRVVNLVRAGIKVVRRR